MVFLPSLGALRLEFFNARFLAPLAMIGKLRYGMYLLHIVVPYFLWPGSVGMNEYLAPLPLLRGTTAVPYLSYRYFEIPVNRWVSRVFG